MDIFFIVFIILSLSIVFYIKKPPPSFLFFILCTSDMHIYSQLNDEDHLCPALENIFESHDVLVLKAL